VRSLAAGIFVLQTVLSTGVALYAPALALEAFLGLPIWISIVGIGISGTIYTSIVNKCSSILDIFLTKA